MKTLIWTGQCVVFFLIMLLGSLYVRRTGKPVKGTIMVWVMLVLSTGLMAFLNLQWVGLSMASSLARAQFPDSESLVDVLPDGTHVLAMIVFGWVYGIVSAAMANLFKGKNCASNCSNPSQAGCTANSPSPPTPSTKRSL